MYVFEIKKGKCLDCGENNETINEKYQCPSCFSEEYNQLVEYKLLVPDMLEALKLTLIEIEHSGKGLVVAQARLAIKKTERLTK